MLQACDESSSGRFIPRSRTQTSCSPARRFLRSSRFALTLSRESGWGELRYARVFPDETAETKLVRLAPGRADQTFQAEIAERIGTDLPANLVHREIGGDQLLVGRHVDAQIARIENRRRRHAHVHLARPGVAQQC